MQKQKSPGLQIPRLRLVSGMHHPRQSESVSQNSTGGPLNDGLSSTISFGLGSKSKGSGEAKGIGTKNSELSITNSDMQVVNAMLKAVHTWSSDGQELNSEQKGTGTARQKHGP